MKTEFKREYKRATLSNISRAATEKGLTKGMRRKFAKFIPKVIGMITTNSPRLPLRHIKKKGTDQKIVRLPRITPTNVEHACEALGVKVIGANIKENNAVSLVSPKLRRGPRNRREAQAEVEVEAEAQADDNDEEVDAEAEADDNDEEAEDN